MKIAVVVQGISKSTLLSEPWIYYRPQLAERGIGVQVFQGDEIPQGFRQRFNAMLLHVWLDYRNPTRFEPRNTLRLMERYSVYRAEYPDTVQIIANHTDMARRPFATPYWRVGDPVLYRTPAYDRRELHPFPPETIWPYEKIWGGARFGSTCPARHKAGFVGRNSGPPGYRQRVAEETAKVGVGLCSEEMPCDLEEYNRLMSDCQIVVCPRGWGEQSMRHWDAWLSGKPVLTDRDCDSVEMIPGLRLQAGIHYLVYEEPEQIPEIVAEWTDPARAGALARIAEQGREAALSYDGLRNLTAFLEDAVPMSG